MFTASESNREFASIVAFLLVLAIVFVIGFQAGQLSSRDFVHQLDKQMGKPEFADEISRELRKGEATPCR